MALKISVVTATYNCEATLPETLASLKAQTHQDFEHVVVDGLSTDRTLQIVQSHADARTSVQSEKDRGIYDALNKGIARSTGDVIGFLHADDMYADPSVLADIAQAFSDPAVDAVYGDLDYVSRDDPTQVIRHWHSGEYRAQSLRSGWMPPHPTLYVRASVYRAVGAFDTQYRIAADYDSILRILLAARQAPTYLPRTLIHMRVGGASNRSLSNMWMKSKEDIRIARHHGVGGLGTIVVKNLRKLPQFLSRR
jgi:glycosyltransferase